ncbi:BMP family ABC transporter substrate-binding protein [Halioxenophilus sp. WMMB6]|uniref:BMP family ABC transporter substrate-binding protein n=1 Tax=Halioxenophilus sp. WMMB6 TaxID=3073815 RepID=UPI00295EAC6E|nr:BMP family ABC transporter substrate-binding protein [Halioxenophilus sp. WMMB6]
MRLIKKLFVSACVAVVATLALPITKALAEEPLQVGFLHENPVGQGGWTLSHELARKKVDEYFQGRVVTTAIDGIAPGVDAERILTKYARDGKDLIFATSFGYLNPVKKVAQRYRKTTFEHASGYLQAANVGTFQIRAYQGRYLSGILAGKTTKADVIGYVGSFPIPEVLRGINAFTLGVQSVNPNAKVELIWTNSWSDPAKEKEATELLIAKGADVITHHTESASVIKAAAQAGVYGIGYQSDRAAAGGEYHLASVVHNWFPIYKEIIEEKLAGTWQSKNRWVGVEKDASQLVSLNSNIPQATLDLIDQARAAMISGEVNVFRGPITDQASVVQIAAGESADDAYLLSMQWLVKGVNGQLDAN